MSETAPPETLSAPPLPWHQGLTVGRYSLVSRIAIGGMAEIWLARQVGLQGFEKFVVIKRIIDGLSSDPEFVGMFLDEARIAAQLHHPHIVQIYDLGEEEGAYYIAMEYLPGENLATVVRAAQRANKPLPFTYAARIIADAAEALGYAHARCAADGTPMRIVHRDVSPHNLFVTYDGVLKVLDFGIAKAATRENHTMGGQLKGKTGYLSPEQARGEELDGRADLFALGVILFELVTSSRLFQFSDALVAVTTMAGDDPIPLAHERNPQVPEALSRIIAMALVRDRDQRYPSARHFQAALEEWLRTQPEVPTTAELTAYMTTLFSARIQERAKLLESARTSEPTPSRVGRVMSSDTSRSIPLARVPAAEQPAQAPPPWVRLRLPLLVGGAVLLLALGVGVALALRSGPESPPLPPVAAPSPPVVVPEPPVLTIETEPAGARVVVDGKEVGLSPVTLETLELGEHSVTATLEGRQPASSQVTLGHAGERAMVVLALPPVPAPAPVPSRTPDSTSTAAPTPRRAMGRLTLETTPWTRVFLRGRQLGDTPLIDVALPAGRHQLKLVNEEKNISTIVEVRIRAGQPTVKKLKL